MGLILSIIASILYGINPSFVSIVLDSGVATTDVSIICSSLICLIAFIVCKICKVDLKMSNQYIVPMQKQAAVPCTNNKVILHLSAKVKS